MTAHKSKPLTTPDHTGQQPSALAAATDTLTVLAVMPGHRATKLIRLIQGSTKPNIEGFDAGMFYMLMQPLAVTGIAGLSVALTALESLPNMFVIRGAPEAHVNAGDIYRRLGSGNGSAFLGNFRTPDHGRSYILIDFDDIPMPPGLLLTSSTIPTVCEHLVSLLPPEFMDVSYHWQLSSSAGLKDPSVVSVHIWFWLRTPIPDIELLRWAKCLNAVADRKTVDTALFQHVQAHYTAAPIFIGMCDPFPMRSGLTAKKLGSVDLILPPVPATANACKSTSTPVAHDGNGFEHFLSQIGDHQGGGGFHMPIVQAIASYVSVQGADCTDEDHLVQVMQNRILGADTSNHEAAYIDRMASRDHLVPAIRSAVTKYGSAASQRKSRLHHGMASHFTSSPTTIEAAGQQLVDKLEGLF